jgi:hypothetical protein
MSKYVIEKNVPIAKIIGNRDAHRDDSSFKGTVRRMEVGDSFLATNSKVVARATIQSIRREFTGREYVTRSVDGGVRIWRVA